MDEADEPIPLSVTELPLLVEAPFSSLESGVSVEEDGVREKVLLKGLPRCVSFSSIK